MEVRVAVVPEKDMLVREPEGVKEPVEVMVSVVPVKLPADETLTVERAVTDPKIKTVPLTVAAELTFAVVVLRVGLLNVPLG